MNEFNYKRALKFTSEINVTPLVDVMLVLLIIFMICSPMLTTGVEVDLPKTKSAAISGNDEPLIISIDKRGSIFIQNAKTEPKGLQKKLHAILKEKVDTRIFVRGDKNINYGTIMKVFSDIKNAGFSNVALVTENN